MNKIVRPAVAFLLGAVLCSSVVALAPTGWRQDGTGRFPSARPPLEWSKQSNVRWKTKMPGPGFGSPVVVGERIFVVSYPGELLCLRASDGKVLWRQPNTMAEVYGEEKARDIAGQYDRLDKQRNEAVRAFNLFRKELRDKGINPDKKDTLDRETKEKLDTARKKITDADRAIRDLGMKLPRKERRGEPGNAAATPAYDGKYVAAVFGNGIVAVYSTEGKRQWIKFIETPTIGFGHSASPVLVAGKLIVHLNDLVALDPATGKELWRLPLSARHASPIATRLGKEDVLITPAGPIVRVRDGKVLSKGKFSLSESSPLLQGGVVYASNSGQIRAFKLSQSDEGDVVLAELWKASAARDRRTPSSVLHDGLLYAVNTNGMLEVIDTKGGEQVYKQRLPINHVYSSITLAGGYLFVLDMRGKAVVFKPGRRYEQVALNQLEGTGASPVFIGDHLYVRGQQHLYCLGAKADKKEGPR
jgi:outer membrane protein assembly factor BamB